jgi:hypothetical protein
MATSGTTAYTMTARDVINYALRKLQVLGAGETLTDADADLGMIGLNVMLKSWQMNGPNLWRFTDGSLPLVANTAAFDLPLAYRVTDARFRQNGRDIPMCLLTRTEYADMPLKTSTGIPTQYYFDPQRATGRLFIWPVMAAVTTETIGYTYQRRFESIVDLDDEIDIPQEYLGLVGYGLAVEVAPDFGTDAGNIERRFLGMMAQAMSADREPVTRFEPSMRG